jgi:hypothetical protein
MHIEERQIGESRIVLRMPKDRRPVGLGRTRIDQMPRQSQRYPDVGGQVCASHPELGLSCLVANHSCTPLPSGNFASSCWDNKLDGAVFRSTCARGASNQEATSITLCKSSSHESTRTYLTTSALSSQHSQRQQLPQMPRILGEGHWRKLQTLVCMQESDGQRTGANACGGRIFTFSICAKFVEVQHL